MSALPGCGALAEEIAGFAMAVLEEGQEWMRRAEKAEAELEDWSQSNRLDELQRELIALQARAKELEAERDTLKESLRLVNLDHGLWMTRTHAAEDARDDALARVKELEALHDAAGRLIKAKGRYHTEKNYRALAGAYDAANAMRCTCRRCQPNSFQNNRMILCSTCGNKRCPHANDHQHACTGSNEPGQPGSAY